MDIQKAIDDFQADLHTYLGFTIPNRIGAGLQFQNIVSELIDKIQDAPANHSEPAPEGTNNALKPDCPQGEAVTPCRRCGNVPSAENCNGYCEPCYHLTMSA